MLIEIEGTCAWVYGHGIVGSHIGCWVSCNYEVGPSEITHPGSSTSSASAAAKNSLASEVERADVGHSCSMAFVPEYPDAQQ